MSLAPRPTHRFLFLDLAYPPEGPLLFLPVHPFIPPVALCASPTEALPLFRKKLRSWSLLECCFQCNSRGPRARLSAKKKKEGEGGEGAILWPLLEFHFHPRCPPYHHALFNLSHFSE